MCSVGWQENGVGYRLFFNRDEQWSRLPSESPAIYHSARSILLYAADPVGSGTWLATNAAGITVAVLNSYVSPGKTGSTSRGKIPLVAGFGETSEQVIHELQTLVWENYAPCWILLLTPAEKARLWLWNGEKLQADMPLEQPFLTTSSVDTTKIVQLRRERFETLQTSENWSHIFDDTDASYPAAGIYMSRPDAGTVSQTRVEVSARRVTLSVRRRGEDFLTVTAERIA